jgi:hypothetical protein
LGVRFLLGIVLAGVRRHASDADGVDPPSGSRTRYLLPSVGWMLVASASVFRNAAPMAQLPGTAADDRRNGSVWSAVQ